MNKTFLLFIAFLINLSLQAQFNVVGSLKLDMPFTAKANDVSGNHNNGIVHGAVITTDRLGNADNAQQHLSSNRSELEIQQLPVGIYFLNLQTGSTKRLKK